MIHEFENKDFGISAFVEDLGNGKFCMRIKDNDANEFLPTMKIYNSEAQAIAYAKHAAGVPDNKTNAVAVLAEVAKKDGWM